MKHKSLDSLLKSKQFAQIVFLMLQVGQILHTSHVIMELTGMQDWRRYPYGILTAIGIDLIIVYLVSKGDTDFSWKLVLFYGLTNLFAYHMNDHVYFYRCDQWNITGFFVIIPSFFIPYSIHQLSKHFITTKSSTSRKPRKKKENGTGFLELN